ncbi:uncharacterized protein LOC107614410 isoform X2 [Arachis ipaensis]|uniref:uncharacterized protein LOC107614410 isoform X2 n=1 Tax=Arachis ipaensis TaxID=130454 RepID=UPI0007AFC54E|nr:uncharacterized protein LOC107614410 isoform X2 [Arachis ipaensis]
MGSLKHRKGKFHTILKHHHLRTIATLFHYAEFCVVLVLIFRLSIKLPMALKNSSEYLGGFVVTPRFVFLLGNFIIVALFVQSGHFSSNGSSTHSSETVLYEEFIQKSSSYINKEIQERTESIKRNQNVDANRVSLMCNEIHGEKITKGVICLEEKKEYRRCRSDILRHVEREKPRHVLYRCESVKNRGNVGISGSYPEDGMSNDEFRRTIEAFIARQQRLRRQEQCFIA